MKRETTEPRPAPHLEALGYQRTRLISCLAGARPSIPFEPRPHDDVFLAFREWVAKIATEHNARPASPPDAGLALLGAARLLAGDLAGAAGILENLPAEPPQRYHGAGYCLLQPLHALATSLPLPPELRDTSRWIAGSAEQAALGAWLTRHREQLAWDEPRGIYTLPPRPLANPEQLRATIARLAQLDRLNLNPALPPGSAPNENDLAHEQLLLAGTDVVPLIEAAIPAASGTGRVALTSVLLDLDPRRARATLQQLVHDETPAWVDTCLVGFRTVKDWACHSAYGLPLIGLEPLDVPGRPRARRPLSSMERWAIALIVMAALWLYLRWWA